MRRFRDRALVLKRFAYGESSLVVHLLTREHGRVHVLAKGAYRPTSRFFAVLDLFDTLAVEWSGPHERELKTLHAGDIVRRRKHVTRELATYRAGLTMLELAELAARAEHRDPALFDLAERGLDELNGAPQAAPVEPTLALVRYELGFLRSAGLEPALERCAACAGEAPPVRYAPAPDDDPYGLRVAFSAGAGGRLCRSCAEEARAAGRRVGTLPVAVLDTARELARAAPLSYVGGRDQAAAPSGEPGRSAGYDERPPSGEHIERVRDFVGRFLGYHLETRPRMHRAFLATANRNAP